MQALQMAQFWGLMFHVIFRPPPRRRFKMGADGSRRRSSAASHEALPLGRPHGPYESCLPFKGFGRARTSDLVWSRRLTLLVCLAPAARGFVR